MSTRGRHRSVFASAGDEPRRRRPTDAVVLAVSALALLLVGVAAANPSDRQGDLAAALAELLDWLEPLWSVAYAAATGTVIALIAIALIGRRARLAADLVLAGVLAVAATLAVGAATDGSSPGVSNAVWAVGERGYPAIRVAMVTAVVMVALPEVTRPIRRLLITITVLAALAAVVLGVAALPDLLGGLAVGLVAGAAVRLAFGTPAGFPHEHRVISALRDLGLDLDDVRRDLEQPAGEARFRSDLSGEPLLITVHGRDARDAQLLARVWRLMWYRDAGAQISFSRLQQVEHEALMHHTAAQAGAPVAQVVAAGAGRSGDAVLVTREPEAPALVDADETERGRQISAAWAVAAALRSARVGHGQLNASSFLVGEGGVLLTRLAGARMAATASVLAADLAELLVSTALLVGQDEAVAVAVDAVGTDAVRDALPYIQRPALSPGLRDVVRHVHFDVNALRKLVTERTGAEAVEIAEVRRVSVRSIVLTLLVAIAAYALISQIANIGLDTIVEQLRDATWGWAVLGFVLAQLTMLTEAVATQAAVGGAIPLGPTVVLQSAIKFINLTVPSTAGKIALNVRYLQRLGVGTTTAISSGALDGLAGLVIQAIVVLFVWPTIDFEVTPATGDSGPSTIGWLALAGLAAGVIAIAAVIFVPAVRRRVVPILKAALANVKAVASSPERAARLLAANAGSQLLYAFALGAAVRAFGVEVSLAELLFVNTASSLLAGLVPVPGGIGVAEAGITAGLVAVGVPDSVALAAALLHRMVTYYLPPIWGYFSLRWLTARGYL